MASSTNNGNLLIALGLGGALYWWWQQQNAADAYSGVSDNISGDVADLSQKVSNYVENAVVGSTRGERNNNPGNINLRNGAGTVIPWQGLSQTQTDSRFAQFTDVTYGIRALHKNTMTMFGRGLNTVQSIISAYAPPGDNNDTAAYISAVCKSTGFTPTQTLDLTDLPTVSALCNAIIIHENGSNPYVATGQFAAGMALS
jgi:hypothetical protein